MFLPALLVFMLSVVAVARGHATIKLNARRSMFTFSNKKGNEKVPEVANMVPFSRSKKTVKSMNALKTIAVTATIDNLYLDYSMTLELPEKTTIGELKAHLHKKFPKHYPLFRGKDSRPVYPPLYCGSMLLDNDSELIGSVWTSNNAMPLSFGVLFAAPVNTFINEDSGGDNSVSDTVSAYLALTVKQAYLSHKLTQQVGSDCVGAVDSTEAYKQLHDSLNSSLYALHGSDIDAAMKRERDPEIAGVSEDYDATFVERERDHAVAMLPTLQKALTQFTSIGSLEALQQQLYWSAMLWLFANYGTSSELSKNVLLGSIGLLWLSTLRSFRFLGKLLGFTVLPWLSAALPLSPLLSSGSQTVLANFNQLPAPAPVPAFASASAAELQSNADDDTDSDAVLSRFKVNPPTQDDLESFFEYR